MPFPEGDHIKVTASKYPFPTVCADKQSTDWFHSISRTLKWNERERQKSFVVVEEEGPAKSKHRSKQGVATPERQKSNPPEPVEEAAEDDEEDEVSDEEEDGFDIDDSSPEAANLSASVNSLTAKEASLSQEKTSDNALENAIHKAVVASALKGERRRRSKSRSRSRNGIRSGLRSGVDSPSRYADPQPHAPLRSPRRVEFTLDSPPDISESEGIHPEHRGARDDIHSSRPPSGKSRIPKDRDMDLENVKTPTPSTLTYGRSRSHSARSRSADHHGRRAFAVWGHDESDSNASDSSAE